MPLQASQGLTVKLKGCNARLLIGRGIPRPPLHCMVNRVTYPSLTALGLAVAIDRPWMSLAPSGRCRVPLLFALALPHASALIMPLMREPSRWPIPWLSGGLTYVHTEGEGSRSCYC